MTATFRPEGPLFRATEHAGGPMMQAMTFERRAAQAQAS
jgi:hypothetical protein